MSITGLFIRPLFMNKAFILSGHNRFKVITYSYLKPYSKSFKMATYEEVKNLSQNTEVYLIDVRSEDELVSTGVIPGSINIPLQNLAEALKLSDNEFKTCFNRPKPSEDATLIFSCLKGGRAQKATDVALSQGFKNAKPYLGSWTEWAQKQGL